MFQRNARVIHQQTIDSCTERVCIVYLTLIVLVFFVYSTDLPIVTKRTFLKYFHDIYILMTYDRTNCVHQLLHQSALQNEYMDHVVVPGRH